MTSTNEDETLSMVAHLRNKVSKLEGTALSTELEAAKAEVDELKSNLRELERQNDYLQSTIGRLEDDLTELRKTK